MTVTYLGLSTNQEGFDEVRNLLGRMGFYVKWSPSPRDLQRSVMAGAPSIVFLVSNPDYDVYELAQSLTLNHPLVSVLLLDQKGEINIKQAMRAGAADVLNLHDGETRILADIQETLEVLEQKASLQQQSNFEQGNKTYNARIMTICSTKGGVGKTTLAVNLAAALSRKELKVAVVDMNLQFGDLPLFLDIRPKRTIYDWVKEEYGRTDGDIEPYLEEKGGIHILSAPLRPELAEVITEEHIRTALEELRMRYDVVLIDSGASLDERLLTALEKSQDILLMTYLDLPTLKNTKQLLDTLDSLSMRGKVKVILNRDRKQKGLNQEMAEKIIGLPFSLKIPNMEKVVTGSVNEGKPFIHTKAGSRIAKSIVRFGNELYPEPTVKKRSHRKVKRTEAVRGNA